MKLVTIDKKLYKKFENDKELLHITDRPCVVVIKLKYREKNYDFAVPIRSNIPAASPKEQYFPLPPRPTTKPKNRHGIHYIKMFPIEKKYLQKYHTEGNIAATLNKAIIDKNTKEIVDGCQKYLDAYQTGKKPEYSTNIDYLIKQLHDQNDPLSCENAGNVEDDQFIDVNKTEQRLKSDEKKTDQPEDIDSTRLPR